MRNALVTGGAGFIGSAIVHALVKQGDNVRVLDNFSTGNRNNLAGVDRDIEIIEGDLRDPGAINHALTSVDVVFHEAAFVSVPHSMTDPETCDAINVHGTSNLLARAQNLGVQRVVLASSAAVYGDSTALPLIEDEPLSPLSPYALSKQVNELYAKLYDRVYGLETVCLRYFNVYGPRQSPNSAYAAAIPIFIRTMLDLKSPTIFGDGSQGRDFIFVDDVVRANLKAANANTASGQIYNICSGEETTITDLVDTLNHVMGSDLQPVFEPVRTGDIYRSLGNPGKAQAEINFVAETSIESGLAQTAAWGQGA